MKVIIGTESLRHPLSGIGVYTHNLCKEFLKNDEIELIGLNDFGIVKNPQLTQLINNLDTSHITFNSNSSSFKHFVRKKVRKIPTTRILYNTVSQFSSFKNLKSLQDNYIYHAPNYISNEYSGKKIITVHDISHIDCPETHPKDRVKYLDKNLCKSIDSADHVIVDSEFTKERILKSGLISSQNKHKISAIHLAACPDFNKKEEIETQATIHKYGLKHKQYLLSIGTLEPRKNYENIISAFFSLPKNIASQYELIIIGAKGWKYEKIISLLNKTNSNYRVRLLGYVPKSEMVDLLNSAKLFLYPSKYEGFGLPILESMNCATPVITSNIGAMKEVAGNAAELVDPHSIESIANSILQLVNDSYYYDSLIELGMNRALQFSWAHTAKQTIDIYKTI